MNYLIESYPDYIIDVGVEDENSFLIDELKDFTIIDDLYSAAIKPYESTGKNYSDIEEINIEEFENFKEIHQSYFGEGYWNFERIKDNFGIWKIYFIKDKKKIKVYIFIKIISNENCEIFDTYGENIDDCIKLIEHSLSALNDRKLMYYFIEDYDEMQVCEKLGFEIHGHYQVWEYHLKND